jgi:hypothetical protein
MGRKCQYHKDGEITSRPPDIFVAKDGKKDGKNKYKVELTLKRRVVVYVEALSEDEASLLALVALDVYHTGDDTLYDELILGPDTKVEAQ